MKAKRCKICGKMLRHWNQSGYCRYDTILQAQKTRRAGKGMANRTEEH